MSTITFDNTKVWDDRPALSLQDVFQMYAALGGVHQTQFDSLHTGVPQLGTGAGEWTVGAGTWTDETTYLQGEGTGSDFMVLWYNSPLPSSFVVDVDLASDLGYLAFRGNGSNIYYIAEIYPNYYSFYLVSGTTVTELAYQIFDDMDIDGGCHARLAVRETTFSSYAEDRWLSMSLWVDDRLVNTHLVNIPSTVPGLRFGLALWGTMTAQYGNLVVPDLYDVIPSATIDPSEPPWGGISRAVADKVVKSFVRYDGTLRVWRPKASTRTRTLTDTGGKDFDIAVDIRELATRVRLFYSVSWVDVVNTDLIGRYGHRFLEQSSAIIEAEDEALVEGQAILRRLEEAARTCTLTTFMAGPFVEPEDRVLMPDSEDYILDSISQRMAGGSLQTTLGGRHYVFQ